MLPSCTSAWRRKCNRIYHLLYAPRIVENEEKNNLENNQRSQWHVKKKENIFKSKTKVSRIRMSFVTINVIYATLHKRISILMTLIESIGILMPYYATCVASIWYRRVKAFMLISNYENRRRNDKCIPLYT